MTQSATGGSDMAKSFNQVIIMGNLTRDPELRTIPSGQSVCSFAIAVNRAWTGSDGQTQESTDFFDIVAWGKLGELVNQYLQKGRKCLVVGRLQTRSWEAQDGSKRKSTEIVANDVTFLDGGSGAGFTDNETQSDPKDSSNEGDSKPKKSPDVVIEDIDEDKPIDLSTIPF
jgi:single-strand DNA-binding protein